MMRFLRRFAALVEIRTKVVSITTFALATFWVAVSRGSLNLTLTLLLLAAVLLVDMGTTAFNTFFDFWNGTDDPTWNREADKILVHEKVAPALALVAGLGCYAVAALFGLVLALVSSGWVLLVGALGMAVGFFYSGGPSPISHTPFGEVLAGSFLGGVLFALVCVILGGHLTLLDVALGLPSSFLVASVLSVNNTCDLEGDRRSGRHTLSVLVGYDLSMGLIVLWGVLAWGTFGVILIVEKFTWGAVFPWSVAALLSMPLYRQLLGRRLDHTTKGPSMRSILRLLTLFTFFEAVAFCFYPNFDHRVVVLLQYLNYH